MKAVVLAAGEGSRLKPFTATRPKVMIPVGNKPILEYVIEALRMSGIVDIILVVGYKSEKIKDYFGNGSRWGVNIDYVEQFQQLGTAHALQQVSHLIKDFFLVVNGDTIVDVSDIIKVIRSQSGDASLLTVHVGPAYKYGVIQARNGLIHNIHEKPAPEENGNVVNAGLYRLSPKVFEYLEYLEISDRGDYDITDVIKRMIQDGHRVTAVPSGGIWMDALYPWDLLELNAMTLKSRKLDNQGTVEPGAILSGHISLGHNSTIRSGSYVTGPVSIGDNCDIGPNTVILPNTSIGNNCTLEPFTRISNSILMGGVKVASFSHISGSIIGEGATIGPGFIAESGVARVEVEDSMIEANIGAIIGDNTDISGRVLARPGNVIGTQCKIGAGAVLSSNILSNSNVI